MDPAADRLRCRLELSAQFLRCPPGPDQFHHPCPILRWTPFSQILRCPPNRGNSNHLTVHVLITYRRSQETARDHGQSSSHRRPHMGYALEAFGRVLSGLRKGAILQLPGPGRVLKGLGVAKRYCVSESNGEGFVQRLPRPGPGAPLEAGQSRLPAPPLGGPDSGRSCSPGSSRCGDRASNLSGRTL